MEQITFENWKESVRIIVMLQNSELVVEDFKQFYKNMHGVLIGMYVAKVTPMEATPVIAKMIVAPLTMRPVSEVLGPISEAILMLLKVEEKLKGSEDAKAKLAAQTEAGASVKMDKQSALQKREEEAIEKYNFLADRVPEIGDTLYDQETGELIHLTSRIPEAVLESYRRVKTKESVNFGNYRYIAIKPKKAVAAKTDEPKVTSPAMRKAFEAKLFTKAEKLSVKKLAALEGEYKILEIGVDRGCKIVDMKTGLVSTVRKNVSEALYQAVRNAQYERPYINDKGEKKYWTDYRYKQVLLKKKGA